MNQKNSRRMSSIARQLNISNWFRSFWGVVLFDLLLVCMIAVGKYGNLCYRDGNWAQSMYFTNSGTYESLKFVIEDQDDKEKTEIYIQDEIYIYRNYIRVLLIFEAFYLFFAMFGTSKIRRKLKPLNDLAVTAENISQASFDMSKMDNLEAAIKHASPDGPETTIHTGDKDLQSIEVALNNLLIKMKESERKQARFVSDASHELRTPIAVIQGYVNMLDRWGKEDAEVLDESIAALKSETENMKELVEQLLFLARGDNGRNTLNMERINLCTITRDVWEESMMIDEKHKYTLNCKEDCFVEGDVAMIKQCLRIFIQNSSKYSEDGSEIKLSTKKVNGKVMVSIQDEGVGMAENDVVHIFERFYRSDEARNSTSGGTGLGLSIAKWIADSHKASIEVLSRKDLGTRFSVIFNEIT